MDSTPEGVTVEFDYEEDPKVEVLTTERPKRAYYRPSLKLELAINYLRTFPFVDTKKAASVLGVSPATVNKARILLRAEMERKTEPV